MRRAGGGVPSQVVDEGRLHTMVQLFLIACVVMSPYLYLRGRALLRARRALRPSVTDDPPAAAPTDDLADEPERPASGELARVVARIEAIGTDGRGDPHDVWIPDHQTSSGRVLAGPVVDGIVTDALARSRVEVLSRVREPGGHLLTCRATGRAPR